jgi:hypothetical protein
MIKRLTVAVAALFALGASAFAAGTIPYSLSQQLDEFGKPLSGCKLYLIQAGTVSTPQNGYQDSGLTLVLPNPLTCDAAGRLPQFFLADGSIKVRLTKSNGVNVVTADGILVVGASSGGGGGSPVDPTTIIATGDVKARYGTGVLAGFVRLNGRTIGSATSGATERANADTQALFEYLWNTDVNLSVSGGRGASSIADWGANKAITLPDMRGRMIAGLEDMGNSAAGRMLTCANATTLGTGCAIATDQRTVSTAMLPSYTLPDTVSFGVVDPGHVHTVDHDSGGTTALLEANVLQGTIGPAQGRFLNYAGGSAAALKANSASTGITLSRTGTVTSAWNSFSRDADHNLREALTMAYNTSFDASNKADFVVDFSATDSETGSAIDFTGAAVSIKISDLTDGCYVRYSATIGSGITQPTGFVLELTIPAATMAGFRAGTYRIGGVYSLNGSTIQLFVGDFVVYDGIAAV